MSRYKLMRYKPNDIKDKTKINWQLVDSDLRSAMEKYYYIKVKNTQQPIFMDFIIKIMVIILKLKARFRFAEHSLILRTKRF